MSNVHVQLASLFVKSLNVALKAAVIVPLKHLEEKGAFEKPQDEAGATQIFIFPQDGCPEGAEFLVSHKADVDEARNNHTEIVKLLLSHRASMDKTTGGASPVYIAAQKGCDESLKVLLDEKANPNEPANDGATPLVIAAQNGHQSSCGLLLAYQADINMPMSSGASALFVAAQNGHLQVVTLLVEKGADVKQCLENGTSPFYIASQNGHLDVVRFLYKHNASLHGRAASCATPFFIASQNGHGDVLRFLIGKAKECRPDRSVLPILYNNFCCPDI